MPGKDYQPPNDKMLDSLFAKALEQKRLPEKDSPEWWREERKRRLQAQADRLGIEPEEYQRYEYNTPLGAFLTGMGFAPPLQGKYEDHSIFNPKYWETNEYDRAGKHWRDDWERKNFLKTWQDPDKPRRW